MKWIFQNGHRVVLEVNPSRCFILHNGDILSFSADTVEDLPVQGSKWPKPQGWRSRLEAWLFTPVLARHWWRQRQRLSYITPAAFSVWIGDRRG